MPEASRAIFEAGFPVPLGIAWSLILPILLVIVTGIVAMVAEVLAPRRKGSLTMGLSVLGLLATLGVLASQVGMVPSTTLGMVLRDNFGVIVEILLVLGCLLCLFFSESYLREKRIPYGEFYPLVLWSTAGGMLMATSTNLLVIFIGLEMLSIALYVLAGMSREESKSEESALKYFILGAFASGFFLFGIAQYYGATGSLDLIPLSPAAASNPLAQTLVLFGFGLMVVGLGFKSALVPFHQWTPDVYQGAPTNVTAFMAVVSKTAAIAALFRLMSAGAGLFPYWGPALQVIAILTMVIGNAVALLQTDVKRILGYSSIAHAGYLLVGLLARSADSSVSEASVLYYLLSYGLMTIGAFAIVSMAAKGGREGTQLKDLNGLWKRSPLAATLLMIFVVSLIGIPPFAGFFGKLNIFRDAMQAGLPHLAIVLAASSIISVAYYLQIVKATLVSDEEGEETAPFSLGIKTASVICAVGLILAVVLYDKLNVSLGGPTDTAVVASQSQNSL